MIDSASNMLHVAAFSGGNNAPPARFRVHQYTHILKDFGVDMHEFCSRFGAWPPLSRWVRPLWLPLTLADRLPAIVASRNYDVTLLQRSFVSTYITLEKFTKSPRVLDVDDAIWNHPRGDFAAKLARLCDSVICGNDFLADYFSTWNDRVVVVPTGVDVDRFVPALSGVRQDDTVVIGWSGSSSALKELYKIESALARILFSSDKFFLSIVSDQPPHFSEIPERKVKYTAWSPGNEVSTIQDMDIGIMPLEDNISTRGKCSYKMLLYMSCAKPVVVSPVGMNQQVLAHGNAGLAAQSHKDWADSLLWLAESQKTRKEMGMLGREITEKHYSLRVTARQLADHLCSYT